jgi:hypothetical protein
MTIALNAESFAKLGNPVLPMSALGHKRTFSEMCVMSASPLKADISRAHGGCPLSAKSGRYGSSYSKISSASAERLDGTSMPSALAVGRLEKRTHASQHSEVTMDFAARPHHHLAAVSERSVAACKTREVKFFATGQREDCSAECGSPSLAGLESGVSQPSFWPLFSFLTARLMKSCMLRFALAGNSNAM